MCYLLRRRKNFWRKKSNSQWNLKTVKEEKGQCLQQCHHGSQAPGCCLGKNTFNYCHFPPHASNFITVDVPLPLQPATAIMFPRDHMYTISVLSEAAADESSGRDGAANQGAQHWAHLQVWEYWRKIFILCTYLNMYQQDCECHEAGQDIVLNFHNHTKLAKLHPSSSKVFLQLRFLHTLSLDLYNWISTICICCLP